jgi:transposase-like protein
MKLPGTDLELHDHPMRCPYCKTDVVITSPMEEILVARRTCPACQREFVIDEGKPVKEKKPPQREA